MILRRLNRDANIKTIPRTSVAMAGFPSLDHISKLDNVKDAVIQATRPTVVTIIVLDTMRQIVTIIAYGNLQRRTGNIQPQQVWEVLSQRAEEKEERKRKKGMSVTYMSPTGQLQIIQPLVRKAISVIRENTPKKESQTEIVCMAKEEEEDFSNFTKDTWYVDSAASTHMGNLDVGMFNYEDLNKRVTVGNGKTLWAKKCGKICLTVI
jgi:hypothetical protein